MRNTILCSCVVKNEWGRYSVSNRFKFEQEVQDRIDIIARLIVTYAFTKYVHARQCDEGRQRSKKDRSVKKNSHTYCLFLLVVSPRHTALHKHTQGSFAQQSTQHLFLFYPRLLVRIYTQERCNNAVINQFYVFYPRLLAQIQTQNWTNTALPLDMFS